MTEAPSTGHIDFLQIRNGAVHILDYKPDCSDDFAYERFMGDNVVSAATPYAPSRKKSTRQSEDPEGSPSSVICISGRASSAKSSSGTVKIAASKTTGRLLDRFAPALYDALTINFQSL
jgi:hypothetical protein